MNHNYATVTKAELIADRSSYNESYWQLVRYWQNASNELSALKEAEMHARRLICELTFAEPIEGANTHSFGDKKAAKLTMTQTINRSLDIATLGSCLDALKKAIGEDAADEVIVFKPSLGIGAYKKLSDENKILLADTVTASVGAPSLKFTPAKEG